jgi:hypothetical protein
MVGEGVRPLIQLAVGELLFAESQGDLFRGARRLVFEYLVYRAVRVETWVYGHRRSVRIGVGRHTG